MSKTNVKKSIRSFLCKITRNNELDDSQDIFGSGLINSLYSIQLILFLEKEFDISIQSPDLNIENFRTVNALTDFIEEKLGKSNE